MYSNFVCIPAETIHRLSGKIWQNSQDINRIKVDAVLSRPHHSRKLRSCGWLLTALVLSSCASDPGMELAEDADTRISTRIPGKAEQAFSDGLYLILSAELAGQEGQLETAFTQYRQLLQLHPDALTAARCTQIALYLKKYPEALEALNIWLKMSPDDLAAHRLGVITYLRNAQHGAALDALLFIVNHTPPAELEIGLIDLIKALENDVEPADAMQLMQGLAQKRPTLAESHLAYALVAGDQRQFSIALHETDRALQLAPENRRARLLQVELLSRAGDSPDNRRSLQDAIRKDPHNARLHMVYSQYLAKSGDIDGARKQMELILASDPKNHDARFGLALIDMETGREDSAYQILEKLSHESQGAQQAAFYLGLLDLKRGRIDDAVRWFDRVSGGTLEFEARVNAITARIAQNQLADARARMANARSNYPKEALKFFLLEAEMLSRSHDYLAAFELLNDAIQAFPAQADLFYARALVAEQLGRLDTAEADLRTVLRMKPDDPAAMNALGYTLADHNSHLDEASELLKKALSLKPDDAAFEDSYGWLEFRMEHYAEAEQYLRRAWQKTGDAEIGAHLVEVLLKQEKTAEALEIVNSMRRKDPDNEHLRRLLQAHPELHP